MSIKSIVISAAPRAVAVAAVLCLGSGLASAQSSVQVFGIIDAGILTQNKTSTVDKNLTRLETSGLRQSVWGLKGTEDLGGGLKAFFNLESHFDTDTGAIHGTGDAPGSGTILFRRQANVGLSGDWGTIILGRQYGPALLAHLATEPRYFKEQFSNLYAWAYNQLEGGSAALGGNPANGVNRQNDVGIFMKNSIQYRNSFGPVSGGILYSLGEEAGKSSNGSVLAIGLAYSGPVALSFSYEYMKDQNTGTKLIEHTGLGAAVPYGDFTFKTNWLNAKNSNAAGMDVSEVNGIGVGVDYKWHPQHTATVAFYDNKDKLNKSNHTKNLVISNDYAISKRTTIYSALAYVDADVGAKGIAGLKTSIIADASFLAGAKTTFLNVGINHNF